MRERKGNALFNDALNTLLMVYTPGFEMYERKERKGNALFNDTCNTLLMVYTSVFEMYERKERKCFI